ncbi:hypothetical protein ALC60_04767 [Trachymyrmex zeteki]|uniref:Chitin-binding type-2 domain-containing protein n=1 Tax=Mycetomoellerius zeteki TaxID=64791 RepID=A0A151X7S2_9HYME|nr:PREDICTED: probable endochitinase [Trachymyrmex zeteki]KYQ56360.1 hypothetical protein ALC60_04767 [Trachymyrmex zeteki]
MNRFSIIVLLCLYTSFKIAESQTTPTCTEIGSFEIFDGTCRNYYICVDDGANLNPVILSCANSFIFVADQGRCVSESTATCQQTTTAAPLTTTTSAPLCSRYGRFPIQDVNCKSYYLCYWNGTNYTIMDNLSCPNTLVFNPTSEKCVSPQTFTCQG